MELEGVVHNGVIVPQGGTSLPEGMKVRIVPNPEQNGNSLRTAKDIREQDVQSFVESLIQSKGVDTVPPGYDFVDALNVNGGPHQRPLFVSDQSGKLH